MPSSLTVVAPLLIMARAPLLSNPHTSARHVYNGFTAAPLYSRRGLVEHHDYHYPIASNLQ
jgi:hypothetical protein